MKKLTQSLAVIATMCMATTAFAQVGIGTTNPQQKLHIDGTDPLTETIRIEALNNTHADNNGIDLSPLAVDTDGNIVIGGPSFLSNSITDLDETAFIEPSVTIATTDGAQLWSAAMHTENFTLTQQTLVEINFSIPVRVGDPAGGPITDGIARWYGVAVYVDGGFENWYTDLYTNYDDGTTLSGGSGTQTNTFTSGPFMLNGSVYVSLAAGAHTMEIFGTTSGATRTKDSNGSLTDHVETEVEFGGNPYGATLKLIKHN